MKSNITIISILLLQVLSHYGFAQDSTLAFHLVEGPEGKPLGHIRSITQDKHGYIWMAAQSGRCIYRFDGNRFVIFKHDEANPNSLGGTEINSIYADDQGLIWIGMSTGLDQYNPETGIFKHYEIKGRLVENPVLKDRKDRLWIPTGNGLVQMDIKTGKTIRFFNEPGNPKSISSNSIWNIYEDHEGVIWVATGFPWNNDKTDDGGLNKFNADGSFTRYKHDPKDPLSLINNKVGAMYEDSRGVFWVGTGGDGLHIMDRKTGKFQRLLYDPKNPDQISRPPLKPNEENDKINFITGDSNGNLWIGTEYSGLNRYDTVTKKVTHYENSNGFPAQSGWNAFTSRDGEFWIATEQDKVYRVDPSRKSITNIPAGSVATRFMEDNEGNLWVGTLGNGLLKYDQQLNLIQQFKNIPKDSFSLSDNFVISVFQQNENTIWVGTGSTLRILDKVSQRFSRFSDREYLKDIPGSGFPNIFMDRQGIIWFCRWGYGLISFNTHDSSYNYFKADPEDSNALRSGLVLNIIEDKSGGIWTGGINSGGINRLNRQTGKFIHYLPKKSISSIFEATDGTIWADGDDGIYRYQKNEDKFVGFHDLQTEVNSLHMNGIVEDGDKNLWINSESALIRLNPSTKETFIYGRRFGIDQESLNIGGIYINRKGQVLAGNKNGFYVFYPKELNVSRNFVINLTRLAINSSPAKYGKDGNLPGPLESLGKLDLSHNQNNLSFEFSAMDYRNPEAIKYFFMLEGVDREWQEVKEKKEKSSSYFNLSPGNYTYRVKAFNDEGTMAEKAIIIYIHPPWWKTWWAYTLYGLISLSIFFALYREQKQRIIQKERQKQQAFELAQAKEIEKAYHELRSTQAQLIQSEKMASLGELTAGIAHEIQNPLNFVNNFAEVNIELLDELKSALNKSSLANDEKNELFAYVESFQQNQEKINEHGRRADAIVKSMLQHSRTSSGQKEPTDINALADEYLRLAYHGLRAKDKSFNVALKTDFDDGIGKIQIIPQDIGRVLLNLYNNAFYAAMETKKNTPFEFEPVISVSTRKDGNKVTISVEDNGSGIAPSVKDKIFQPFFTTKPTGQGTGLGLSLSYDIVKAHGGNIVVKSPIGRETVKESGGTLFTIELPV